MKMSHAFLQRQQWRSHQRSRSFTQVCRETRPSAGHSAVVVLSDCARLPLRMYGASAEPNFHSAQRFLNSH